MGMPAENNIGPNFKGSPAGQLQQGATRIGESKKSAEGSEPPESKGKPGLTAEDKKKIDDLPLEKLLSRSFKFLVAPLCGLSFLSSIGSFFNTNFLNGENEFIDKVTELSNKGAYFFNGAYGSLNNALSNNIVGALGYSLVSVASIVGNNENMYQWKAPGSILDQLPTLNDNTANNKKIMEKYGEPKYFKVYKNYKDSVIKTYDSFKIVCSDIYDEYKSKLSKGENIIKATTEVFITNTNKRYAERHLVISSIGMSVGFFSGIVFGFKKFGATIRDIFGIDADTGILATLFSPPAEEEAPHFRTKYGFSGAGYLGGGFVDLIYRWIGIAKTDLLAVGLDNLGFGFMTSACADSNKKTRELAREAKAAEPNFSMAV